MLMCNLYSSVLVCQVKSSGAEPFINSFDGIDEIFHVFNLIYSLKPCCMVSDVGCLHNAGMQTLASFTRHILTLTCRFSWGKSCDVARKWQAFQGW